MIKRCNWAETHPLLQEYHDTEWGVPIGNDLRLFEFLALNTFQCGLSWLLILKKRQTLKKYLLNFDPYEVSKLNSSNFFDFMNDPNVIRNKMKLDAIINNAKVFLEVREKLGSFGKFLWNYVDFKPIVNLWKSETEIPTKSHLSDLISKDMKKLGFKFVGSVTIYAYLQSVGIINDHLVSCFRYYEIIESYSKSIDLIKQT